jgi:hypothetical protein
MAGLAITGRADVFAPPRAATIVARCDVAHHIVNPLGEQSAALIRRAIGLATPGI